MCVEGTRISRVIRERLMLPEPSGPGLAEYLGGRRGKHLFLGLAGKVLAVPLLGGSKW